MRTPGRWGTAPGFRKSEAVPVVLAFRSILLPFLLFALAPRAAAAAPADPWTHRFTAYVGALSVDPDARTVAVTVRASGVTAGPGRDALVVACGIPVTAVADAEGLPLPFAPADDGPTDRVVVTLPAALADGAPFTILVTAAGTPACLAEGGEGTGQTAWRRCGVEAKTTWFDLATVLPRSVAGLDFATLDLEVTAPAGLAAAGSGEVAGGRPAGDGRTAWHLAQPVPAYTRGLVLGPFFEATFPTIRGPVRAFAGTDPAVLDAVPAVLARAADAWTGFAADYGPAPAPGLSIAQVDAAGAAVAMAGMAWLPAGAWTGVGGGTIHPADLAAVVLPHEVAHQWFPIAAAPVPLGGTWLSEGLAETLAIQALGRERGASAARDLWRNLGLRWRLGVPMAQDAPLQSVASADGSTDRQRFFLLAYAKAAVALRALQAAAGADAFRSALAGLAADLAPTGGFFDAGMFRERLEAASGRDLSAVFAAWTAGRGFPIARLSVRTEPAAPGRIRVRIDAAVGGSIGGGGLDAAMPSVAVDVRTDAGTTRAVLPVLDGAATAWLEADGRFLDLVPDPDAEAPGTRFEPALAGDVDFSGEVDGLDLLSVAIGQGAAFPADARYRESCDLDASGTIDGADLAAVVAAFGHAL